MNSVQLHNWGYIQHFSVGQAPGRSVSHGGGAQLAAHFAGSGP